MRRFGGVKNYWLETGSEKIDEGRFATTKKEEDGYGFLCADAAQHREDLRPTSTTVRSNPRSRGAHMAAVQLGRTLDDATIASIVAFLESLTGEVPARSPPARVVRSTAEPETSGLRSQPVTRYSSLSATEPLSAAAAPPKCAFRLSMSAWCPRCVPPVHVPQCAEWLRVLESKKLPAAVAVTQVHLPARRDRRPDSLRCERFEQRRRIDHRATSHVDNITHGSQRRQDVRVDEVSCRRTARRSSDEKIRPSRELDRFPK